MRVLFWKVFPSWAPFLRFLRSAMSSNKDEGGQIAKRSISSRWYYGPKTPAVDIPRGTLTGLRSFMRDGFRSTTETATDHGAQASVLPRYNELESFNGEYHVQLKNMQRRTDARPSVSAGSVGSSRPGLGDVARSWSIVRIYLDRTSRQPSEGVSSWERS